MSRSLVAARTFLAQTFSAHHVARGHYGDGRTSIGERVYIPIRAAVGREHVLHSSLVVIVIARARSTVRCARIPAITQGGHPSNRSPSNRSPSNSAPHTQPSLAPPYGPSWLDVLFTLTVCVDKYVSSSSSCRSCLKLVIHSVIPHIIIEHISRHKMPLYLTLTMQKCT